MTTRVREAPRRDEILDEVLARLDVLTARVATLELAAYLRESDRDWLAVLTQTIGAQAFTARTVIAQARSDPRLGPLVAGQTPRTIGARLKRIHRHPIDGFDLVSIGRDHDGCIWRLSHRDDCARGPATV